MATRTQLAAYRAAEESGMLSKRRAEVFKTIVENHPITLYGIVKIVSKGRVLSTEGSLSGRLSELQEMDLIHPVGEQTNPVSGMKNILWAPTGREPRPLMPKVNKTKQLKKLQEEVESLKGLLRSVVRESKNPQTINRVREALEGR